MRTTLTIDDDVLSVVRNIAAHEQKSLGAVISDLVRRGLQARAQPSAVREGVPAFQVSPEARVITDEMVRDALEDTV